jgi:UDP-N-acetylmuramyl pentapeptide synthase
LLRTPVGRNQLVAGLDYRLSPLAGAVATLHRVTLARNARVVAVVGSLGKTTTARAVRAVLTGDMGEDVRDNHFGHVARGVLALGRRSDAVLEVGIDRPGQMARYARIVRPDVVVVTSVASEHNRSLRTLEATASEKARMVAALPAHGLAVLNADDERVRGMARATTARVVSFGVGAGADVRATQVELDWPRGTRLTVTVDGQDVPLSLRLIGMPGVSAALAALAVARELGLDLELAAARLAALPPTPMRLAPVALPNGAYLIRDEFKSTLETIELALDVLAAVPATRRIAVLGEVSEPPGSQGPIYRELGARLAGVCDRVLVVSRNYRRYVAGARAAGLDTARFRDCSPLVAGAIAALEEELRPGDVVLLKGRDTERLDRIAAALLGRTVRCALTACDALPRCERCRMLERGWDGLRAVL